jgi:6-hydroxycyclohex-1-ene-1-carbonyl-CoA dehydrogenase
MEAMGWFLDTAGAPLQRRALSLSAGSTEAIVEVTACGLCHTDLGYADGSVAPRHPLPLVLGHEVVGTIVDAGEGGRDRIGQRVIVPAVLPCGDCVFCRSGRANACLGQKMPGNDVNGGFATHLLVPVASLVEVPPALAGDGFDALSVVADAVSTAYQAVRRSELAAGDVAFVVGAGGVGAFAIQIAKAMGATVVAFDVSESRLELARSLGADEVISVADADPRAVKKQAHGLARALGVHSLRYRIFETSGTTAGQSQAFGLLAHAATLVFVGYTPKKLEVRLSNLMAFDATAHGTWGCPPDAYPAVLELIAAGKIVLEPLVARAPMSQLNALLDDMAHHRLTRRMVLDPRH